MRTIPILAAMSCCLLAVACGPPPWQQPVSSVSPTVRATPLPSSAVSSGASSSASAPPAVKPASNDLAKGSLERKLTAGNTELTIKYWSTLDLARWTPGASKPLSLSASAAFTDDSEQDIYLSEVKVAVDAVDPDGGTQALETLIDKADVKPGFVITAPTSYGQVFTLPPAPAGTRSLTVTLTYQLLVQTAPEEKRYSRQAAVDILEVALAS